MAASPVHRLSANERREQLIQVAVDLFSRKGFNGTTTREIASAAGVTEAIIFRHFETKEHLYSAIIDSRMKCPDAADFLANIQASMKMDDDAAVIRQLISAIIDTHKTDPKFERLMIYAALEGHEIALLYMRQFTAPIIELFRSYLLRRQEEGHLKPVGPDAALIAIAGVAHHYALTKYIYNLKEHWLSDEQALDAFTGIAMTGLCLASKRKKKAATK